MKTRWNKELKSAILLWICSMGFLHAQVGTWNLDLNSAYPVGATGGLGFTTPNPIVFYTDNVPRGVVDGQLGNWGIGTQKPVELLHVRGGNLLMEGDKNFNANMYWTHDVNMNFPYYMQYGLEYLPPQGDQPGGMNFWKPWLSDDGNGGNGFKNYVLYLRNDGKVSVGSECVPQDALMGVSGKLYAQEIEVNINSWCDSVFNESYALMPLDSLRSFIATNKHLPHIESESEVLARSSVNLMEMNLQLLRKVEELHLYILQLDARLRKTEKSKSRSKGRKEDL